MTNRQLIVLLRLMAVPGHELPESELEPTIMRQLGRPQLVRRNEYLKKWWLTPRGAAVAREAMAAARRVARRWRG